MVNDSNILPPQFMFLLAGSLFIVGSIIMHIIRVFNRSRVNDTTNLTPTDKNNIDEEKGMHFWQQTTINLTDSDPLVTEETEANNPVIRADLLVTEADKFMIE